MFEVISDWSVSITKSLDRLWGGEKSFCLVGRTGPDSELVSKMLERLPFYLNQGHFGIFTSGSTGLPKLVIGQKIRSERLAVALNDSQNLQKIEQTICLLPLSYSFALINQWLWSRVHGREFIMTRGLCDPEQVCKALEKSRSSMTCLVGSQVLLLRKYFENRAFPKVNRVNFAGERFPQEQMKFIHRLFPNAEVFNNYGCTEAMPRLTLRHERENANPANIGHPLLNIKLKTNNSGRLYFSSPYGAIGVMDSRTLQFKEFKDWVATDDFAQRCSDGSWEVIGRTNEIFKRFGEKVSVHRVTKSLTEVFGGDITTYLADDNNDELGYCIIVSPEPSEIEVRKALKVLRDQFSRAYWPLRVESVKAIPKLQNGKVDLKALKSHGEKKLHWRQRI